ncbi:MAG: hypothetical protein M3155_06565 [Actinomycetota bacterium]|nr:hypothetical protein [Actinomycetota bacterium]
MIKKAWKAGWWARQTGKGKVLCYPSDGGEAILVPSTPSDHRSIRNLRAEFARRGLDV